MKRFPAVAAWPAAALAVITLGFAARLSISGTTGDTIWMAGLALTGAPVVFRTFRGILSGRFASDIVATLAIVASLLLFIPLPGLIVVLMQTGGEALERFAEGKASTAVRELEAKAPSIAHRVRLGVVEDVPVDQVVSGDTLVIRPGDLVPCDSVVTSGQSAVDASGLTGEPIPVDARPGVRLMSGSLNGQSPLTVTALAPARESQYARIVELVRTAQASKSPFQRMADRYAVWFTPLTLIVCLIAYYLSADWSRVLAVLVVATPCPLILAAPVAIIGGINRAARHMIIFRNGGAVEALGQVTAVVFDKTGTLTLGRPQVTNVISTGKLADDPMQLLRLASGVEQCSGHPMARTLVEAVLAEGLTPPPARQVEEIAGQGVVGEVEGQALAIGGRAFIERLHPGAIGPLLALQNHGTGSRAYVAIEGAAAGIVEYEDRVRSSSMELIRDLRRLGLAPLVMLSGDHEENAAAVAASLGLDQAEGDLLAADKVDRVRRLMQAGHRVVMLGDGTNDAPALSAANVGVALASGGSGITAESADVVLLADDPRRLAAAISMSRDTLRIARQSVWAGIGLSGIAMVFAAGGMIPPAVGAVLQEVIDVAVILNALRSSAG